jgi:hypothetical protein
MTCYKKSQVSYIASNVGYDHSQIVYLDSTYRYFANEAQRNIEAAVNGSSIMRNLLAAYYRRAAAWSRNTGSSTADPKTLQPLADRATAFARSVAVPRLQRGLGMVQYYDAKAADLTDRASRFSETVECSG